MFESQWPHYYGSLDEIRASRIHLSSWNQLPKTISRKFRNETNTWLLSVDLFEFEPKYVHWRKFNGEEYPHIVGCPITRDQIIWLKDLSIDHFTGNFEIGRDNFEKLLNKNDV
jgi:uncharacterized protein (DUF952 family)